MSAPTVSLVVLSFRRFDETTRLCLDSLLAQPLPAEAELVLVDNGSDDGAADSCALYATTRAAAHPALHYHPLPRNLGFPGGMNAGAAVARGRWLCLVNSDTVFPSGALQRLIDTLQNAPVEIGLIGPVTNAAGNGQALALPHASLADIVRIGANVMRAPTGLLLPTYRCDFYCVAIRTDAWRQLGGLDEVFGLGYYEDFDFSLRARAAGFQLALAEDVFVVHAGSLTFRAMGDTQRALLKRNHRLMRERHPQARFEHQRLGNAQVLAALLDECARTGWTDARRQRAAWRHAELLRNEPRTPWKRWLWRWRHRQLRQRLADARIAPALPA